MMGRLLTAFVLFCVVVGCARHEDRGIDPYKQNFTLLSEAEVLSLSRAWPKRCEKIKLMLPPAQDQINFTPRVDPPGDLQIYTIPWKGVDVAIPALHYTEVRFLGVHPDGTEWILRAEDGTLVTAVQHRGLNATIDNIFAIVGQEGDMGGEHPDRRLTESLFGPSIRILEILEMGYGVRQPLKCSAEHWHSEMKTAIALILKGGGVPGLEAVYPGGSRWGGFLEAGEREGRAFWRAIFSDEVNENNLLETHISIPIDSVYVDFGLIGGNNPAPPSLESPELIATIIDFLEANNCPALLAVVERFVRLNISEGSMKNILSYVERACP
ncbi:hypothetical protein [Geoalkalibacter halelectricus]|uniref:hypothetical protein n=1 Tax=Geoalkalibacter halelectricus TaxID=2847045 RepID=UPI003D1EB028